MKEFNTQFTVLFVRFVASLAGKAPPGLTLTLTRTSAQRLFASQQEEEEEGGLALAPLASLATCPPPSSTTTTGGFAGGVGVSIKAQRNHAGTHPQPGVVCLVDVRVRVYEDVKSKETYLGVENRDAASFFLIFLHSVGHLGGAVP